MVTIFPARHLAVKAANSAALAMWEKRLPLFCFCVFASGMLLLILCVRLILGHEQIAWWRWLCSVLIGLIFIPLVYVATWAQHRYAGSISLDDQGIFFGRGHRLLRWWKPTRCELMEDRFNPGFTHFRVYGKMLWGREVVLFETLVVDASLACLFMERFGEVYVIDRKAGTPL